MRSAPWWALAVAGGLILVCPKVGLPADAPPPTVQKRQGFLPFGDAPIHYRQSSSLQDPVAVLNRELAAGKSRLDWDARQGYLPSVLQLLRVPVSSQTLVYSKTSLQFRHIDPASPRALYFNDNVYVGRVLGARSLELIAFDAQQGAVFYVLDEERVEEPRFERAQLDCVQCHIAAGTRGVPGVMVRSVATAPSGYPKGGARVETMGHETPFEKRWAGWYVSGHSPGHAGNTPPVDAGKRYLTPHSDVVAHLVLAHQTQMHNYITELNYRYRLVEHAERAAAAKAGLSWTELSPAGWEQVRQSADATLRYLLFVEEARLPGPVRGSSAFAEEFVAVGPKDSQGRSLRDFDLRTRLFRYPLSYLIYTDAFDALPARARDYVIGRLLDVLTGADQSAEFASLDAATRAATLEILLETKPGFADQWRSRQRRSTWSSIPPIVFVPRRWEGPPTPLQR